MKTISILFCAIFCTCSCEVGEDLGPMPTIGQDWKPQSQHTNRTKRGSPAASLRFSKGDIISCTTPDWMQRKFGKNDRTMLASSSSTVIHAGLKGLSDPHINQFTFVLEDHISVIPSYDCQVVTEKYDGIMGMNYPNNPPTSPEDAVTRGQSSVRLFGGLIISYDSERCNSDHWVTTWKYGQPYSPQTDMLPSNICALYYKHVSNPKDPTRVASTCE